MPVSQALENSAKTFNAKYGCDFDFARFESKVEEFTFLRPIGGWIDVYKMTFERMYKRSLESVATGKTNNLDSEAMLDDFEYTLIRPYLNESENAIKHKSYVGMDRIARLEYLNELAHNAPKTPVGIYSKKYKSGEITINQMRSMQKAENDEGIRYVEIAGCVQVLEAAVKNRTAMWRLFHPFRSGAEKRAAEQMKKTLFKAVGGREDEYLELAKAAYEPYDAYQGLESGLKASLARAREEMTLNKKINGNLRESLHIEGFDEELRCELSRDVEDNPTPSRERQI